MALAGGGLSRFRPIVAPASTAHSLIAHGFGRARVVRRSAWPPTRLCSGRAELLATVCPRLSVGRPRGWSWVVALLVVVGCERAPRAPGTPGHTPPAVERAASPPTTPTLPSTTDTQPTPAARPSALFEECAERLGVRFVYDNGRRGEYYICEIIGGGVALFDYDNDGDLDLYFVQGGAVPGTANATGPAAGSDPDGPDPAGTASAATGRAGDRLYRNQLVEAGRLGFEDVTETARLPNTGYGMGVAAGDFDNDGWVDLYVTCFGPNVLLRNNGNGTFTDHTRTAGADDDRWSTSAAFLDFDHDGHLDLFVCNYVDFHVSNHKTCYLNSSVEDYCGPAAYRPVRDRLLRNRGDGTFVDVSTESRIATEVGSGLGVIVADLDTDGRLDIYVANDALPNHLWIGQRDGTFLNQALLSGCAVNEDGIAQGSMGIDAGDFDGDGDEDLIITNMINESVVLYRNQGQGWFEDSTRSAGLAAPTRPYTGFGTGFIDYDGDGWLDLVTVNGAVAIIDALALAGDDYPYRQAKQLFRNLGNGRFEETTGRAGAAFSKPEISRGAAFGDLDNDGAPDFVVVNVLEPVRVFLNRPALGHRWLGLRVLDGARDALGAKVVVELDDGRELMRRVRSAASYCAANDARVLVGLGATAAVRAVRVHWLDGQIERWEQLELGAYQVLRRSTGRSSE